MLARQCEARCRLRLLTLAQGQGHLVPEPEGQQGKKHMAPVNDDILLAKLRPGQVSKACCAGFAVPWLTQAPCAFASMCVSAHVYLCVSVHVCVCARMLVRVRLLK